MQHRYCVSDASVRRSCCDYFSVQARNCRIFGSDLVERLGLDRRFCIEFVTRLTWTSAPAQQPDQLSRSPPQQGGFFQSLPFGLGGGSGQDDGTLGRVKVRLC